jgi:outer membrane receptor protein involved in Fe transport
MAAFRGVVLLLFVGRAFAESRYEARVTSDAQKKRESAEAVTVVTTERAKRESSDLGQVLNRIAGVSVARSGGLGSDTRFSLNGLSKDQIRFFLNGLPLELAGFAFGLANIPVNLVDQIEIYRGVVPIRLGADALGGAVNLVTSPRYYQSGASASLQGGSFATWRGSFTARWRSPTTGLFGGAIAFFDATRNDYDIDVQVPDKQGRLGDATVRRFHDGYGARGVIVDAGVLDRPWAQRLVLRAFYSEYQKDLQNNPLATIPYGEVRYDESLAGASLQAQHKLGDVTAEAVASYSRRTTNFIDVSPNVYDWTGKVVYVRADQPGETDGHAHDITIWRDSVFSRFGFDWKIQPKHSLRLSSSVSFVTSHGVSKAGLNFAERDPLKAHRSLVKLVSGLEYQADLFADRVENVMFVKHYYYRAFSEELLTGAVFLPVDFGDNTAGAGDALRVRILGNRLYAKASYEYATRLPSQTEVFGDGILIEPNGTLTPERSHNANVGLNFDVRGRAGNLYGELNGFLRDSENLIVLLGDLKNFSYHNVYTARALGVETQLGWRSPGDWVVMDGSFTYQDIRNTADSGAYKPYSGNRIPNMPYLFLNASARGQYRKGSHELSLALFFRWVHDFYRDWESIGAPQYKQVVDSQISLTLSLGYALKLRASTATFSVDADNITNARLFDVYGLQKPGRAFYAKATIDY